MLPISFGTTRENAPGCTATDMWWRWPCRAAEVGSKGMAFDFGDLKGHLKELAERFDHQNLNDIPPFTEIESTAENQARYFFDEMKKRLPSELGDGLLYARVSESPGSGPSLGLEDGSPG